MKPYILNYSETIHFNKSGVPIVDSTVLTEQGGDQDDADEIFASSTVQTFAIEPSDDDGVQAYLSTLITIASEPSDHDEIK